MGVDHGNFNISSFHFIDWMGLFKCLDGLQSEHYHMDLSEVLIK